MESKNSSQVRLLRISTVPHSLNLLLKGQLNYMSIRGFKVYAASNYDNSVEELVKREKVEHFTLPLTRTLNPFMDLWALFKTIKLIKKLRPEIVHSHSPKAGIVGMLAAWFCRVPVRIHTVAGLPLVEASGFKKKLLVWVERITYSCSHYVLPNSLKLREFILNNIYNKPGKVVVIGAGSSNGIDLKFFNREAVTTSSLVSVEKQLEIKTGDIVFCFVGRLANYKGVNELIKAFTKLQNIEGYSLKLILVGPMEELNPLETETQEQIDKNRGIKFVGHQNDIRPYLMLADIFIFPSYREGFPQSLMQAAAMNLACVATDISGCNEIIEDNVTGILITPKDEQAIYLAGKRLIMDPVLRTHFSNTANKNMKEKFEQKAFWDKLINFYNNAL